MADDGIDWGSLSDADWGDALAGGVGNIDWASLGIDPAALSSAWGMGDRGLGTTDPSSPDGTLTADQIDGLTPADPTVGFKAGGKSFNNGGAAAGTSSGLASLAKSLGLVGKDGSPDLLGLASILGPLLGGIMAKSATSKASDQMQGAARDANAMVQGMYAPAQAAFQPYMTAGQNAVTKAAGMTYQPLAPQFQPLGAGRATTLGALGKGR